MSNNYKCENCGGTMAFSPDTQTLKCGNCGKEIEIENDESVIVEKSITDDLINSIKAGEKTSHTMKCEGCGAKIEVESTNSALKCPYCGMNYVLAEKQSDVIIPDGLVPFMINKRDANIKLKNWIENKFWAPKEMKTLYQRDSIQGIYIPYWAFDANGKTDYTAKAGIEYTDEYTDDDGNIRTKTYVSWHNVSGTVDKFIGNYLVPGSDKINIELAGGLNSFNLENLVSYSSEYIPGYSAECFNIDLKEAHEKALSGMKKEMKREVERTVESNGFDIVRNIKTDPEFRDEKFKYVLLPIYSTGYKYRNKVYQVLVNGQTGEINGKYPKSIAKIILAVMSPFILLLFIILIHIIQAL